ncbi:RagB/SusD family nutrient uptake outer membrane protein [Porphyromonadaceae bacterium OttesenSCG-928-L07]|nr:RagB/SusD family nutrient uptake outer membrane protein [Porphyromonadaceae bacterium OttesenSCG-928-L07]MDL2330765.1 RagB/SusD family nutrient uptake outer membrane protein [Odoribacter sp. OttesenSCG-928-A06]
MRRYLLLLILILPVLVGCNSFLDTLPDDRTQVDSPDKMKEFLVSCYPMGTFAMFTEFMSDNVTDFGTGRAYGIFPLRQDQAYEWKTVDEETQDTPTFFWLQCYGSIAGANAALEIIEEKGDTDEYKNYKAEALLCRAYNHFMLVNLWAKHYDAATASTDLGVPYVTKPETEALVIYERETVKTVYDMIEKDLTEGLPNIDNKAISAPKWHFNRDASYAFASRFYLYRGLPEDWQKVVDCATEVLGPGTGFGALLRDYPKEYKGLSSNIEGFGQKYGSSEESANLMLINASSIWFRWTYGSRYGLNSALNSQIYKNSPVKGTLLYADFSMLPNYFKGKFWEYFEYAYPGATSGTPYNTIPAFTIEEVVFNRAEANVMLERYDEALDDLNVFLSKRLDLHNDTLTMAKVLKHYNNPDSDLKFDALEPNYEIANEMQHAMLQCITDFRRKEFLQEGMRWFDLRRFNLPVVHTVSGSIETKTLERRDVRKVLQIPELSLSYGMPGNR